MRLFNSFALAICATFFLSACTSVPTLENNCPKSLVGTTWSLSTDTFLGETPSFTFISENQLSGFSGCNAFMGSLKGLNSRLYIGPIASTRRACEPNAMKTEIDVLTRLNQIAFFKVRGNALEAYDKNDQLIESFARVQ